jgi:hypothetical protein
VVIPARVIRVRLSGLNREHGVGHGCSRQRRWLEQPRGGHCHCHCKWHAGRLYRSGRFRAFIAWRLGQRGASHEASERAERRAVRLVGLSFFGIAIYVVVDATITLLGLPKSRSAAHLFLAITLLALLAMPGLA